MIEIKNLRKSFGEKEVLKGVSAVFQKGKCNLVIGASGSGKSVLMKTLVGLEKINSGEILYDNRDFANISYEEKKVVRREIGMLFQGGALFDSLSVEDNVAFPLTMFSDMSKSEQADRVHFCLKRVNLDHAAKLFPSEISGGMKKRVGIARAIALNPDYLFCDEPNSGLDPLTSRVIDELIQEITQEFNTTTIINSHDMKTVFDIGDNIVFVYKGEKWWEGNKSELRNSGNPELDVFMKAYMF
ncbi:MAG: ATP-binding cassette domain-containing protein [Bacteroidetes bacterium]|nr:ATP-binding cassette domain-containing protein [Bacteroidota bacterium]